MFNLTSSCPFTGQLHQSDDFNHITISSSNFAQSHLTFHDRDLSVFSQLSSNTHEDIVNTVDKETDSFVLEN
jgi:hypothetical protein